MLLNATKKYTNNLEINNTPIRIRNNNNNKENNGHLKINTNNPHAKYQ
jgi:hypothetical protein